MQYQTVSIVLDPPFQKTSVGNTPCVKNKGLMTLFSCSNQHQGFFLIHKLNSHEILVHSKFYNDYDIFDRQYLLYFYYHNNLSKGINIFLQNSSFFLFERDCYHKYHIYLLENKSYNHMCKENIYFLRDLNNVFLHKHINEYLGQQPLNH